MRTAKEIVREHDEGKCYTFITDDDCRLEIAQAALDEARRHYEGEEVPHDSPRIKPGARVRMIHVDESESSYVWTKDHRVVWIDRRYFILADAPEPSFTPTVGHVIASAYEAKACEGWVLILHGRAYQREGEGQRPWRGGVRCTDAEVVGGTLVWGPGVTP